MADFNTALAITLQFEGGYSNDPKDPGGETNRGITMRTFVMLAHPLLGLEPTSANLKALTAAQAGILYRHSYWQPIHGDEIVFQPLANIVFDFFVNSGTHSTSLLQTVIDNLKPAVPIVVDGVIGASTIAALASVDSAEVYANFKAGRIAFYTALGKGYPKFLKGWLARANTFPNLPAPAPVALALEGAAELKPKRRKRKKKT